VRPITCIQTNLYPFLTTEVKPKRGKEKGKGDYGEKGKKGQGRKEELSRKRKEVSLRSPIQPGEGVTGSGKGKGTDRGVLG